MARADAGGTGARRAGRRWSDSVNEVQPRDVLTVLHTEHAQYLDRRQALRDIGDVHCRLFRSTCRSLVSWTVVVVVVQRAELAVVGLMVVHVVVDNHHVTETEALQQVLETLERYPAAVASAVLVEQTSQSLRGRVLRSLVENRVELVVRRHVDEGRYRQRQHQRSKHLQLSLSRTVAS